MQKPPRYDIFLSYRRDGGDMTALYLYERLTRMGYRVAYDFETLLNGRWDDAILRIIGNCKDVVVVLSPGALDRCVAWEQKRSEWERAHDGDTFPERDDTNDWMRREVACAIANGKNILPVLLRDFSFPPTDTLPEDIRVLPFQNGVGASPEHRHDTLARLVKRLTAKPVWYRRPAVWIAGLAIAAALAAAFAVFPPKAFHAKDPYPSSRMEVQQVNELISSVARQATAYESATAAQLALLAKARGSVEAGNPSVYETAVSSFRLSMRAAKDILDKARPAEAQLSALRDTPIDVDVFKGLSEEADAVMDEAGRNLPAHLAFWTKLDNPMDKADKYACIDRAKNVVELRARLYALGIMELFLPIHCEAAEDFKKKTFVSIPRLSGDWPQDKKVLEREQSLVLEQMEVSLREAATLTGDMRQNLARDERAFEALLASAGASGEKAADISGKIAVISARETELTELEGRIAQKKEEAYRKFRPALTDDPEVLWWKVLQFRGLKMPDAARECLDFLKRADSSDFPPAVINAMAALVESGCAAPVSNGVMVAGYEPPATAHAIFRPGDVVSSRDGVPISHFADYKAVAGSRYLFWRLDDGGAFRSHEEQLPPGQPRVAFLEIEDTDE